MAIQRKNYLATLPAILLLVFSSPAQAIPKDQVFKKFNDQGADVQVLGYQPMHDVSPPVDYTLHPNLTPHVNEMHPYPDYIKKFPHSGQFPEHYLELIRTLPVDRVQSKIFNIKDFQKARRISVAEFENKTTAPFKDKNAGYIVANQISQELQSYGRYHVIPPRRTNDDTQIIITKNLESPINLEGLSEEGGNNSSAVTLPDSGDKVDAVLIGAVTKYMDSYVNRRGEIKESISSGVEFGAFLINATTGDVIWGARFVGTQTPGLMSFLQGRTTWLNKEEFSRSVMKKVLKAFQDTQN